MRTSSLSLSLCRTLLLVAPLATGCFSADDPMDSDAADDGGSTGGDDGVDDADDGGPVADTGGDDADPTSDPSDDTGEPGDTGEPSDDTGEPGDTTPPTVLVTSPADGEDGVWNDAVITVNFSEPMNKASVQAAYQSATLPTLYLTMTWNAAGDQLIMTPTENLPYGHGTSLDDITERSFNFSITTVATDVAGNELEEDLQVEFEMLNRIHEEIPLLGSLSGSVRQDGEMIFELIAAGDSGPDPANAQWKGFASFPLYDLPEGIVGIDGADLLADQIFVNGTPYTDLGDLQVHDVEFASHGMTAFQAPSLGMLATYDQASLGQEAFDVTEAVQADFDAGVDTTQFAFMYPTTTDLDDEFDIAMFAATDPGAILSLDYLVP